MLEDANGTAFSFTEQDLQRLDDAMLILLEKLEECRDPAEIESWYQEWASNQSLAFKKELQERARLAIYLRTRNPERMETEGDEAKTQERRSHQGNEAETSNWLSR